MKLLFSFTLVAMMAMPMLATEPTNIKHPQGTRIPLTKIPQISFGKTPRIKPYSLDDLFDYEAVLSDNIIWIIAQENVGTICVQIKDANGIVVFEIKEMIFSGDMIEISLIDWQVGEYYLYLQNKKNIFKGEFSI